MMAQYKINAYHGTSLSAAESIRKEKRFNESTSDTEWLGRGVYFFAYKKSADQWIGRQHKRLYPGEVITVQLEYNDEDMLDLDDPAQLHALNDELKKLQERVERNLRVTDGDRYRRWCLGCNLYSRLHPEIGIVSYTFPRPKEVDISQFALNEKQLCVKRHEIIKCII